MTELMQVCGDKFKILYSGHFKSKPNISWHILQVTDIQRIITIPYEYGEKDAEKLLETKYFFNYMKSIVDRIFYITVIGYPDQIMIAELEKL